jgi:uncharacterized protein (TIGR02444 family)
MSLWEWSLKAWAAPGVQVSALDLQDAQNQCVPLLLWAAWAAQTGRAPDEDTIEAACDTARVWLETTIAPLRQVRRALKSRTPDMDDAAREAVRERVKAVELETERHLLTALEALTTDPAGAPMPVLPVLIAVARRWSPITPRVALTLLSERLPA